MFKLIWLIRDRNFWKQRCERLEEKFDREREANRAHEDEILSRFVTLHGTVGVEAREPEAVKQARAKAFEPPDMETAFKNLNGDQKATLEMYEQDGLEQGLTLREIHNEYFQREILGRQQIEEVAH